MLNTDLAGLQHMRLDAYGEFEELARLRHWPIPPSLSRTGVRRTKGARISRVDGRREDNRLEGTVGTALARCFRMIVRTRNPDLATVCEMTLQQAALPSPGNKG